MRGFALVFLVASMPAWAADKPPGKPLPPAHQAATAAAVKPAAGARHVVPHQPPHPAPVPHPAPAPPPAAAPAAAPPATAAEPPKGSNTGLPLPRFAALKTDDVNLRTGPGTRYPIDWVYKRRDLPVQIEREFEVWRLIADSEGVKGWVHQATLTGRRSLRDHRRRAGGAVRTERRRHRGRPPQARRDRPPARLRRRPHLVPGAGR